MKTKFTTALLILVFGLLLVVSAKANTNEALNVSVKSSGIVILRYTAASKANPKVTILDAKKRVVYTEKISGKNSAARVYNITALPEGEYFFEVVENGVKTVKSITYKKEVASVTPLDVKVTSSSVAGKFDLLLKNNAGDVNVSIYSKSEGVVYEDAVVSKGSFKRTYDLSKLKEGEYVFEVTSNNKVATAEVSLDKSQLSLSK
jgi:flagellar hook assembly protein FlgD